MDRGIPAIPAAGNHEWEHDNDFVWMNDYFDLSECQQYSWWGSVTMIGMIIMLLMDRSQGGGLALRRRMSQ
jgi:hypothetical protein